MHAFKDECGRQWTILITPREIRAIRETCDFRITDLWIDNAKAMIRLCTDYELLADCLWECCKEQAQEQNVDVTDFVRGLYGDALASGQEALVNAVNDFFPTPEDRNAARAYYETSRRIADHVELQRASAIETLRNVDAKTFIEASGNMQPEPG